MVVCGTSCLSMRACNCVLVQQGPTKPCAVLLTPLGCWPRQAVRLQRLLLPFCCAPVVVRPGRYVHLTNPRDDRSCNSQGGLWWSLDTVFCGAGNQAACTCSLLRAAMQACEALHCCSCCLHLFIAGPVCILCVTADWTCKWCTPVRVPCRHCGRCVRLSLRQLGVSCFLHVHCIAAWPTNLGRVMRAHACWLHSSSSSSGTGTSRKL
jgi:hypothetical protein